MLFTLFVWVYSIGTINASALFGRFENIPSEALGAAESGQLSNVVNGFNYQSRIDVKLTEIGDSKSPKEEYVPVTQKYNFAVLDLAAGEYELLIHAYDFVVPSPRYRIFVGADEIEAFEDKLGSASYNMSSKQIVTRESPLTVNVAGFKKYYEVSDGKLTALVMSSPLGVIFRSKVYSVLFFVTLAILVFPYLIPYVAPEFAKEFQQMQAEVYEKQGAGAKDESEVTPEQKAAAEAEMAAKQASKGSRRRR